MRLSLDLGLGSVALNQGGVSPVTILGASLLAWWTADRADLITLNSTAVTSWKDVVAGYDAVQGVSAARPVYSASSFNGAPGVTFDGIDDELTCTDAGLLSLLPDGAEAGEMWAIVDQVALGADTTTRFAVTYGGDSQNNSRRLSRLVGSGNNLFMALTGTGAGVANAVNINADFTGRHLVKGVFGPTTTTAQIDEVADVSAAAVPATVATRLRIGANNVVTAGGFFSGRKRDILLTLPLTTEQRAALNAWALPRRML